MIEDVRRSCHENLTSLLGSLAGRGPVSVDAPRETARRRAEQGVPLAAVLHAFRLGLRVIWDAMVDEARREDGRHLEALLPAVAAIWSLYDTYSQAVASAYDDTLVDLARRDEQQRTLILDGLVEGRDATPELRGRAAPALDLPERGPFVAVSAEVPAAGREGLPRADQVLRRHGIRSAWRLRADEQVGVVALTRDYPAPAVRDLLRPVAVARAGMSPPYPELTGTARAVALATLARRCVPPGTTGVITLEDHPLGSLVAGAPELAERMAQAVLGPVLELAADERSLLLETLEAWVAAGGSASEAGQRLYCHRNTVRNRLHRLEELTGRSLADPRSLAELCAAAESVRLLGLAASG